MADAVQTIFTYEVPAAKWRELCDQLSRVHRGRQAEIRRGEPGAEHPGSDELLVSARLQDVQFDGERVQIHTDDGFLEPQTVEIDEPTSLRVEQSGEQGPGQLRMQRRDEVFVLRFEQPFTSEQLEALP